MLRNVLRNLIAIVAMFLAVCAFIAAFKPAAPGAAPLTTGDTLVILTMASTFLLTGLCLFGVPIYNRLIKACNWCDMAFSNIGILLQRRHDLLDSLIAIAEHYAAHEDKVLNEDLRHRGNSSGAAESYAPKLLAVAEAYPGLMADRSFDRLSRQLQETETAPMVGRKDYNEAVRSRLIIR